MVSTASDDVDTFKVYPVKFAEEPEFAKGTAKHFDTGKPALQWIPYEALVSIASAFSYGAGKYGNGNFRGGMLWSKMIGSVLRHTYKFMSGEDKDDESGLSHLSHLGACVCMLIYFTVHHPELDDRKGGNA